MKQNVIMNRKMGNFDISQRTKDGMFNATSLVKQWNVKNKRKDISEFLSNKNTIEFIEALIEEEKLNTDNNRYLTIEVNEISNTVIPVMAFDVKKGKFTSKGRTKDKVWMHPLLFIKFSMWLNPRFEVQVLKFVYDELIKQRNDAGDNYISLSASGVKLQGYDFREVAIAMNWIVFNQKGKNLRQSATQEQLKELNDLQGKLAFLIDNNYITSYSQLIKDMRKMYNNKYQKF